MNTRDMTLGQFLDILEVGNPTDLPMDILKFFGHTEESAANTEHICFSHLNRSFEIGELPSFAVSYLLRSGMTEVKIKQSELSAVPFKGFMPDAGFEHSAVVTGKSDDGDNVLIHVTYGTGVAVFSKNYN